MLLSIASTAAYIFGMSIAIPQMWLWFIVPIGLPSLSAAQSIGILFFVRMLFGKLATDKDKIDKLNPEEKAVLRLIFPWFFLGLGYIVSLFM